MCGIVGYVGNKTAQDVLLNGLSVWNIVVTIQLVLRLLMMKISRILRVR